MPGMGIWHPSTSIYTGTSSSANTSIAYAEYSSTIASTTKPHSIASIGG